MLVCPESSGIFYSGDNLQEPSIPLSSGAGLSVPGHADDGMTVSMILLVKLNNQMMYM